jgi:hypothetical protein
MMFDLGDCGDTAKATEVPHTSLIDSLAATFIIARLLDTAPRQYALQARIQGGPRCPAAWV